MAVQSLFCEMFNIARILVQFLPSFLTICLVDRIILTYPLTFCDLLLQFPFLPSLDLFSSFYSLFSSLFFNFIDFVPSISLILESSLLT